MFAVIRRTFFVLRQICFAPRQIEAAASFCSRMDCDFVYPWGLAARQSSRALINKKYHEISNS